MTRHRNPTNSLNSRPWRDYNDEDLLLRIVPRHTTTDNHILQSIAHEDYETTFTRRPKTTTYLYRSHSFLDTKQDTENQLQHILAGRLYLAYDYRRYSNGPLCPFAFGAKKRCKSGRRVSAKVNIQLAQEEDTKSRWTGPATEGSRDKEWRRENRNPPRCRAFQTRTLRPLRSQVCLRKNVAPVIGFFLGFLFRFGDKLGRKEMRLLTRRLTPAAIYSSCPTVYD